MIEDALINYGVLGLWTLSLLYERVISQKKIHSIIEKNTEALLLVRETITKCPNNQKK